MANAKSSWVSRREEWLVAAGAAVLAAAAVVWSWVHHAFLLYGDAEAHTHIARRLFDSHRPGLGQLGSVWLPLPHLLLMPFVAVDAWWRTGFAGAVPSSICYVLACVGLYRLARRWVHPVPAVLALAVFALNPSLLYLATTAMTEPLFLAELVWTVELLVAWHAGLDAPGKQRLWPLFAVLVAAVLTRYDGWILAALAWAVMALLLKRRGRLLEGRFVLASVVLLAAPVAWMVYNQVYFGDWLDFVRGPYSAKAIELRTANGAIPPHPGWHNAWVSALFFAKAAELDTVAVGWGWVLWLMMLPAMDWAWRRKAGGDKRVLWTLLLWLPLPFYAYSIGWGSVPVFLPVWWPQSFYNTRYGMELLPALALFVGFFDHGGSFREHHKGLDRLVTVVLFVAVVGNAAVLMWQGPLVMVEGEKNTAARGMYNAEISAVLGGLHEAEPDLPLLLDTSMFPSVVPRAGMSYKQTLNESDKEFFKAALDAPAAKAGMVLAFAGDEVAEAVKAHPENLWVCRRFRAPGQPDATLYVVNGFSDLAGSYKGCEAEDGRW